MKKIATLLALFFTAFTIMANCCDCCDDGCCTDGDCCHQARIAK